jgi:hypothetical protein
MTAVAAAGFSNANGTGVVVMSSAVLVPLTLVEIDKRVGSVTGEFASDKMTDALAVAPTAITTNATVSL